MLAMGSVSRLGIENFDTVSFPMWNISILWHTPEVKGKGVIYGLELESTCLYTRIWSELSAFDLSIGVKRKSPCYEDSIVMCTASNMVHTGVMSIFSPYKGENTGLKPQEHALRRDVGSLVF